jgi:hypothetical protein
VGNSGIEEVPYNSNISSRRHFESLDEEDLRTPSTAMTYDNVSSEYCHCQSSKFFPLRPDVSKNCVLKRMRFWFIFQSFIAPLLPAVETVSHNGEQTSMANRLLPTINSEGDEQIQPDWRQENRQKILEDWPHDDQNRGSLNVIVADVE